MRLFEQIDKIKEEFDLLITEQNSEKFDAILVGGLDNRPGDKDIETQINLLKTGLGSNKKIKGFRYNTPSSTIIEFIKKNQGIPVYLFSAGCDLSNTLASAMGSHKTRLYIIEPYAKSRNTKVIVQNAVNQGVPEKNVFVGPSPERGQGFEFQPSKTNARSHWDALTKVGLATSQINKGFSNKKNDGSSGSQSNAKFIDDAEQNSAFLGSLLKPIYSEQDEKKNKVLNNIKRIKEILGNKSDLQEKCWPGYTQKGMKTMFGKKYPNCVKKTKK